MTERRGKMIRRQPQETNRKEGPFFLKQNRRERGRRTGRSGRSHPNRSGVVRGKREKHPIVDFGDPRRRKKKAQGSQEFVCVEWRGKWSLSQGR